MYVCGQNLVLVFNAPPPKFIVQIKELMEKIYEIERETNPRADVVIAELKTASRTATHMCVYIAFSSLFLHLQAYRIAHPTIILWANQWKVDS